jgi:hypothetical protein
MPESAGLKDRLLGEAPVSTEPKKGPTALDTSVLDHGALDREAQRIRAVTQSTAGSWELINLTTEKGKNRFAAVLEELLGKK